MLKNETDVDIGEVQQKIYERLVPSGWGEVLKLFLLGSEMTTILTTLLKEAKEGKRFTPKVSQIFAAFEKCPYEKMSVVMMGQD